MNVYTSRRRGYKNARLIIEDFVLRRCGLWSVNKIEVKIFLNWRAIVGDSVADIAFPKRVIFTGNSSGTLYLRVNSGGHATFLQYAVPCIIEKLSVYFGFKVINSIKIIQ
ncbi:hypothetical protein ANPL_01400 [Anaplasma platys]|uniref:DUF721 domain-containing protein n=1 Tax=Anaplasma platys TaxID=949 RepID=A0A858PXU2_9RICK|nr:DUF721 domain-containing protein [Anaplasma platys]QJC27389.1 hypothetical protein ANPL_01400 [Anaplasma platys]